jgi:hypothetical protein
MKTMENNDINTNESTCQQKAWIKSEITHLENKDSKTNNNKPMQNGQPKAK